MLLIDTSTIVKVFAKESGWEAAEEQMLSTRTIPLALVELGNALLNKIKDKEMAETTALILLNQYVKYAVLTDQSKYLEEALKIGLENKLAIYDSLFIAVALGEGYGLLTSDGPQAGVAAKLGVKVTKV
jgi:predicted nucleic acid-binding protein